jgi:hypothetical protein
LLTITPHEGTKTTLMARIMMCLKHMYLKAVSRRGWKFLQVMRNWLIRIRNIAKAVYDRYITTAWTEILYASVTSCAVTKWID